MERPEADFVEAVHRQRLAAHARDLLADADAAAHHPRAQRALATCERIADQVRDVQATLAAALTEAGCRVAASPVDATRQHHTVSLRAADVDAAEQAAQHLRALGFEAWEPWTRGAHESFRRHADHFTVARTDTYTTVVRVEWRDAPTRPAWQRVLVPTSGDWHLAGLPRWAWWGYSFLRPIRLVGERLGRRPRDAASLGPFLATPDSLIDPLFDFAAITADDVVVDVGCGDGRLVIEAARRLGCRGVGIEHSADLADRARTAALEGGVDERVDIVHGDAREVDLSAATVVLVFLPTDVGARLLDGLLERLAPGGRLVMHEQHALADLPADSRPDVSEMLLADDAVTVAHRWTR